MRRFISGGIYLLSGVLGVLAFTYPFFTPKAPTIQQGLAHGTDASLLTAALVGLSVLALMVELQGRSLSAKTVAMLGVLVAVTSVLRFLEVAFPLPGGFSPIFTPIIIAGYVFGGRFGFLVGTFTLLASALITGGVGPWLPYQMFTAGWAGLTAGWLREATRWATEHLSGSRLDVPILCIFSFVWGLLYGAIMNVYFWPFAVGPPEQTWEPGIGVADTLGRYGLFYAVTSLAWDLTRAAGNVALMLALARPMIKALERFQRRFDFEVRDSSRDAKEAATGA